VFLKPVCSRSSLSLPAHSDLSSLHITLYAAYGTS
jgi:hypothetical protein